MVLGGASVGTGSGHLGARGAATDDVIPRDYHPGDEVRRIDWKASARTGALMVRSEENPWRSAITLVLDLREAAHRGREPESSVDAALSMAASIGCLALESGWDLTVRTTDDVALFIGSPMTGVSAERRELLLALATVPVSHSRGARARRWPTPRRPAGRAPDPDRRPRRGAHGPAAHRHRGAQPDAAARGRRRRAVGPRASPDPRPSGHVPGRTRRWTGSIRPDGASRASSGPGAGRRRSAVPWPPRGRDWRPCDEPWTWSVRGSGRAGASARRSACTRDAGTRGIVGPWRSCWARCACSRCWTGPGGWRARSSWWWSSSWSAASPGSLRMPAPLSSRCSSSARCWRAWPCCSPVTRRAGAPARAGLAVPAAGSSPPRAATTRWRRVPPAGADPGLLLLIVAGIGLAALVVDTLGAGLDLPGMTLIPLAALFAVPWLVNRGSAPWWAFALVALRVAGGRVGPPARARLAVEPGCAGRHPRGSAWPSRAQRRPWPWSPEGWRPCAGPPNPSTSGPDRAVGPWRSTRWSPCADPW